MSDEVKVTTAPKVATVTAPVSDAKASAAVASIPGQPVPNLVFVPVQPPVEIKEVVPVAGHTVPSAIPGQPAHVVGENETVAIVRSREASHAKHEAILKTDPKVRLGFDPGDAKVKRPGDEGVAVHISPVAPPSAEAARTAAKKND